MTVKGIQSYTEKQKPVNIVPVLDVTASMNYCDTPGHTKLVIGHTLSEMENGQEIWEEIKETLPDEEAYRKLGEENPEQLFCPCRSPWTLREDAGWYAGRKTEVTGFPTTISVVGRLSM